MKKMWRCSLQSIICGVPASVRDEVAVRLHKSKRLDPDHLAICSTHTHCAPWLEGFAPNIFGAPISADEQARSDGTRAN